MGLEDPCVRFFITSSLGSWPHSRPHLVLGLCRSLGPPALFFPVRLCLLPQELLEHGVCDEVERIRPSGEVPDHEGGEGSPGAGPTAPRCSPRATARLLIMSGSKRGWQGPPWAQRGSYLRTPVMHGGSRTDGQESCLEHREFSRSLSSICSYLTIDGIFSRVLHAPAS